MNAGNQAFQKQANLSLVLNSIRQHGLISRIEISRQLGLKKSTVSNIIAELLETGIVEQREEGQSGSSGGRRPVYLGVNGKRACILGLEIEQGYYRAVLCDLSGSILWTDASEIETAPLPEMFDAIYTGLRQSIRESGMPLVGIGVGIPGIVDLEKGMILRSTAHQLLNFDYFHQISAAHDIPVFFENDTNCGAWGELWRSPDERINLIYLITRFHFHNLRSAEKPGVGMGLVVNGQVYYGDSYRAGEFGSNYWSQPGTEYLGMTKGELLRVSGDPALMKTFLTRLFEKLSVSFSLYDPRKVLLGGDLQNYQHLLPGVLDNLKDDSWFGVNSHKIEFSPAGDMEIAAGAASMVLHNLYSIPQLGRKRQKVRIEWDQVFARMAARH